MTEVEDERPIDELIDARDAIGDSGAITIESAIVEVACALM